MLGLVKEGGPFLKGSFISLAFTHNNPLSPTHPTYNPSYLPLLRRPTPFTVSASRKHHHVFHLASTSHVPAFCIFGSLYSLRFSIASRIPQQSLRVNLTSLPLGKSVRRHFFFFSFPGCLQLHKASQPYCNTTLINESEILILFRLAHLLVEVFTS